jgi:hypothetical protein
LIFFNATLLGSIEENSGFRPKGLNPEFFLFWNVKRSGGGKMRNGGCLMFGVAFVIGLRIGLGIGLGIGVGSAL